MVIEIMSLTTELLTVLDNTEEPLHKRLRIANNAFNSSELQAQNKQSVILEWIINTGIEETNPQIWKTLNSCLMEHPTDVKLNVLETITDTLVQQLQTSSDELKPELLQTANILLKEKLFQQYFKHDTKSLCVFISTYLLSINDLNELNDVFNIYLLFNKYVIVDGNYVDNYLKYVFDALLDVLIKFDDTILFDNCVKLTHRILFGTTSEGFNKDMKLIFKEKSKATPKYSILKKLKEYYKNDEHKSLLAHKIIFVSFISAHERDPIQTYRCFILFVQSVGFKIDKTFHLPLPKVKDSYNIKLSLYIIAELLEVISKENLPTNVEINDLTLSHFLVLLLTSIIRVYQTPWLGTLKIIKHLIVIDPNIITETISEIIMYLSNAPDADTQLFYPELMISLFEMYLKLHRLHKFCSELLQSLKQGIRGEKKQKRAKIIFKDEVKQLPKEQCTNVRVILPQIVTAYFQQCITQQTNKQIISIMRTFITSLNEIVYELPIYMEGNKMLYVEIVSTLTCEFLSAVRIAEHTTTELTIEKFFKSIYDMKKFLKKFGSYLLVMQHNRSLMFSFLNLCYNWGEMAILLNYYVFESKQLTNSNLDNTAINLTYLHNYLLTTQWSLVSQRIKNFGEQPCKRILQKLIIQKLRAALLFEQNIHDTFDTSIIKSYSSNLESCWDIILTERFITTKFFIKMELASLVTLSDLLINDILMKNNYKILANRNICDSRDLVQGILYVCLSKINNLFKRKRRLNETVTKQSSIRIFEQIDQASFIRNSSINIQQLIDLLTEQNSVVKIDEVRFTSLMEIIKHIPVYSLSHEIQITLFLFLLSICSQTQIKLCETYLIALVENTGSPNILNNEKGDVLMSSIIENTQQYKDILNYCINKTLKQNESIVGFKQCLNILLKNVSRERYFDASLISFHAINKALKYKISEENKECLRGYKRKLCKHLFDVVVNVTNNTNIEAYVLLLQTYLITNKTDTPSKNDKLDQLLLILNRYIDYTIKNMNEENAKGCLLLHELILTNKTNIKDIPNDFNISVWKSCKNLNKHEDYSINFDKTITLLFEHISIEEFPIILDDLVKSTELYLKNHELDKIINLLGIWRNLINSSINSSKLKLTNNYLQLMLEEIMLYIINNNINNLEQFTREYIGLQTNIMENKQIAQSSNIIDIYLQTSQIIISKEYNTPEQFTNAFDTSFSLLETFLKHRKILIVDRLPSYLVQVRNFIYNLSLKSNSEQSLTRPQILKLANCAYRVEQLIKNICSLKKDVTRVAPYLIADILKRYEKHTLYPEVKTHFNNCLNYLLDLCDSHAVSYLLRVLSTASREMFKNMHENYKKYYKFTGKV